MKKIGILTYHDAYNYGAVLQSYALQHKLSEIFPDDKVEIIDYKCKKILPVTDFWEICKKKGVKGILHYFHMKRRKKVYNKFVKENLELSPEYNSVKKLSEDIHNYSMVISGSDQVWNYNLNGDDDVYLQLFHRGTVRKASYAASFGLSKIDNEYVEKYRKALKEFYKISLRENSARKIVSEQLSLESEVHIDPTLLFSKEQWANFAQADVNKKKYILVYMIQYQKSVIREAEKLSKKYNLPIIIISKGIKPIGVKYKHKNFSTPQQFVGYIRDAEYVITNSFHGTVFSIIFNKNFCVELNYPKGYNYRCYDLLKTCRMVNENEHMDMFKSEGVDWSIVEESINVERVRCEKYLKEICDI